MRIVVVAAAIWAAGFSYLAVSRHDAFESNAFDLGYVTQTLWNTAHGRPFVFTTVDGIPFSPEGTLNVDLLRHPHSLLAFHVEPILLLIAPVFALWPDPRLLLVLQAIALAIGAIGVAALAQRRLASPIAAVVFGFAFLLSPSIAAAAMSDFHAVAIAAALIPAALYFWSIGKNRPALAMAVLAALTREDAAILIASLGAYLFVRGVMPPLSPALSPTRGEREPEGSRKPEGSREPEVSPLRETRPISLSLGERVRVRALSSLSLWARARLRAFSSLSLWARVRVRAFFSLSLWERVRVRVVPRQSVAALQSLLSASPTSVTTAPRSALASSSCVDDPFAFLARPGLWLLLGAGLWAIIALGAVIPFFNGTLGALYRHQAAIGSVFWHRYDWLGTTPLEALRNVVVEPHRLIGWFSQRDVQAYLLVLLLTGGLVAAAAPDVLAIALPIALLNALSSFDWMRSGGAHYSVVLVPVLLFAGVEGTSRIVALAHHLSSHRCSFWPVARAAALFVALGVVLGGAAANHAWLGASPAVPGLVWPTADPRDLLVDQAVARVPADASVAASSAVYPHIASRERAYWFPAVNDADYVAIDAASSTSPIGPRETRQRVDDLMASGNYQLTSTAPGFLLFARSGSPTIKPADELPDLFYGFARAPSLPRDVNALGSGGPVRFGDSLSLDGYHVDARSSQTIFGPNAIVTTYWHVNAPVADHLSFTFYVSRRSDGAMVGMLPDAAPEAIWYPPYLWQPGETVHLTVILPRVDDLQAVGVAVVGDAGGRLPIQASSDVGTWENSTIVRITRLDR